MKTTVVGVMGPGKDAKHKDIEIAYEIGQLIAQKKWLTLTGGVKSGVMHSACKGAKDAGGTTIGILPHPDVEISDQLDIEIITDLGSARNTINVLSSDIIIVIGMNAGTSSEVSFSLQNWAHKYVVLLNCGKEAEKFFKSINDKLVYIAKSPQQTISIVEKLLYPSNKLS